ncbi:conserved hypothetical protein [Pyrenophora tritici-repentis Pt-1C-BFP]|uniref:Rad21-Rec8-N domain containing protein n=2 Tax=Pyrenophora tritici-repentis TaxID=45151 RepID=A0A922NGU3_9PLEO|nr:uncharacterized protein PTRG_05324 [Pyrenophora tritici-repentis Pt-1C-BFP]EDU48244.1 conserved hypothetical protein [Pyrenophora tritici-repentis Pt-1C-BFP]KAI1513969.1 Rad21-Rec8-N domain containing protein [Pyrenophora tritici-repentis]KAI1682370.1 Rad21-Rec8-N domain containing protein [Pyrenophora tritici-repentis]
MASQPLVATLGQKSSLKRINRKQILEVDVPKACQTIVDPVAPMALRLQGNLLYGVSRVYLQQCGYVLSDAQNAQNELQMMLRTVKDAALDPDAGRARPEQLILQDDPSFLPDFTLPPPDLLAELDSRFNLHIVHSGSSQSLTPFGSQQSQDSSSHVGVIGGLVLPSSSSPGLPAEFRLEGENELGGLGGVLGDEDNMVEIEDPDFMFGDDGNIIHLSPGRRSAARTPVRAVGAEVSGDAEMSARVRREHGEGRQAVGQFPGDQEDIEFPVYNEDLPGDEIATSDAPQQSSDHAEVVKSSESFSAPQRRHRIARTLRTDAAIELRNKVLSDWNTDYRANMKAAARQKMQYRATVQARKNAEHYVWNSGIGNIGQRIFGLHPNPFDMFIGDGLFESLTGLSRKVTGAKHDRDSGIDDTTQEESRRVRQRTEEREFGRAGDEEEEGFLIPGDDNAVELPREAASALDDQQIFSAMPWNMSASVRGSSAIPRSGRVGMMGGSAEQGRPGSCRLVSASPLHGKGQPSAALEPFRTFTSDADFGGDEFGLAGPSLDFPLPVHGAAPEVATRVREALSTEGANFAAFIHERIREQMSDILQVEAAADIDEISFEELLPPAENTKMIACQGLMMVLALGMKGMLDVQQSEHLGDISLKLTSKAKAMQVVDISDGEESGEEDGDGAEDDVLDAQEAQDQDREDVVMEEVEKGHFQDQFSADHAAQEEDERDSLYDD